VRKFDSCRGHSLAGAAWLDGFRLTKPLTSLKPPYGQPHLVDRPRGPTAGISEVRADRYLGHAGTTVSDRYRHRLRGQLESDAALLDDYLRGKAAPLIALRLASGSRPTRHR
jgi:hypothetical protein